MRYEAAARACEMPGAEGGEPPSPFVSAGVRCGLRRGGVTGGWLVYASLNDFWDGGTPREEELDVCFTLVPSSLPGRGNPVSLLCSLALLFPLPDRDIPKPQSPSPAPIKAVSSEPKTLVRSGIGREGGTEGAARSGFALRRFASDLRRLDAEEKKSGMSGGGFRGGTEGEERRCRRRRQWVSRASMRALALRQWRPRR